MEKSLTKEMLEEMAPDFIFATGTVIDSPEGINMTNSGRLLRWVAVRGKGIPDWAIYCHFANRSSAWIRDFGDKVSFKSHIKKLVPCNDEAFKVYRY